MPSTRRTRAPGAIDDGDPDSPGGVRAGASVPLFELGPPVFEGVDFALKRTFDIIGAIVLLVLASPLLLAITIAVRVSSRGPIFYRSMRRGIGQRRSRA